MGLCEVFCENIENLWKWIEENPDEAQSQKDAIVDYLLESHLMVQLCLGNTDSQKEMTRRIELAIAIKWLNAIN